MADFRMIGAEGPSCVDGVCSPPGEVAPAPLAEAAVSPLPPATPVGGDETGETGRTSSAGDSRWQN